MRISNRLIVASLFLGSSIVTSGVILGAYASDKENDEIIKDGKQTLEINEDGKNKKRKLDINKEQKLPTLEEIVEKIKKGDLEKQALKQQVLEMFEMLKMIQINNNLKN